jgi:hypothetical protein
LALPSIAVEHGFVFQGCQQPFPIFLASLMPERQQRYCPAQRIEDGALDQRTVQSCAAEIGAMQIRFAEIRSLQVGFR